MFVKLYIRYGIHDRSNIYDRQRSGTAGKEQRFSQAGQLDHRKP